MFAILIIICSMNLGMGPMRKLIQRASSSDGKDNVSPQFLLASSVQLGCQNRVAYQLQALLIPSVNNVRPRAIDFDYRLRCMSILKVKSLEVGGL